MGKKISLPETIIFALINGGADVFDVVASLSAPIPVVGQILVFLNPFSSLSALAITEFWLIMKGGIGIRKQGSYLVGSLVDLIPLINLLPTRTATLFISIYLINAQSSGQESESGAKEKEGEPEGEPAAAKA